MLGVVVTLGAVWALATDAAPGESPIGIAANVLFGWSWADPVAALLAAAAVHEGIENLEEANELSRPPG